MRRKEGKGPLVYSHDKWGSASDKIVCSATDRAVGLAGQLCTLPWLHLACCACQGLQCMPSKGWPGGVARSGGGRLLFSGPHSKRAGAAQPAAASGRRRGSSAVGPGGWDARPAGLVKGRDLHLVPGLQAGQLRGGASGGREPGGGHQRGNPATWPSVRCCGPQAQACAYAGLSAAAQDGARANNTKSTAGFCDVKNQSNAWHACRQSGRRAGSRAGRAGWVRSASGAHVGVERLDVRQIDTKHAGDGVASVPHLHGVHLALLHACGGRGAGRRARWLPATALAAGQLERRHTGGRSCTMRPMSRAYEWCHATLCGAAPRWAAHLAPLTGRPAGKSASRPSRWRGPGSAAGAGGQGGRVRGCAGKHAGR